MKLIHFTLVVIACFWISSSSSCEKDPPPLEKTEDFYPIILTFTNVNKICGLCDANSYNASYALSGDTICFTNLFTTDVMCGEYYSDYLKYLRGIDKVCFSGKDTLKLISQSKNVQIILLKKQKFKETKYDIDSLYSFTSLCQIDSSAIENSLQGTSWVVLR